MATTAFPLTRRPRRAKRNPIARIALFTTLGVLVTGGAFWAVSSTLTETTWQDCQAGVARACEELQK